MARTRPPSTKGACGLGTSAKLRAVNILAFNIFMKNEIAHLLLHLELCIVLYVLQDGITVLSFFGNVLTLDHFLGRFRYHSEKCKT